MKDIHDYSDIMNMERPQFTKYKKMNILDRAAQFAPFAALKGHKNAVDEKAKLTEKKRILDENKKEEINQVIFYILNNLDKKINVKLLHFVKDDKKTGGRYEILVGVIKKIKEIEKILIFEDGTNINIENIYEMEFV